MGNKADQCGMPPRAPAGDGQWPCIRPGLGPGQEPRRRGEETGRPRHAEGTGEDGAFFSGWVATACRAVEGAASCGVGRGKELLPAALYGEYGNKAVCLLDAKGVHGKPARLAEAARLILMSAPRSTPRRARASSLSRTTAWSTSSPFSEALPNLRDRERRGERRRVRARVYTHK